MRAQWKGNDKMKILWVCNIMLPVVAEHLGVEGSNKEGWLSGLCSVILMRQRENKIDLHVAFPVEKKMDGYAEEIVTKAGRLHCYGFYEDVNHAERYDKSLEVRLRRIIDTVQPDVVHCFGTEYAHTLAVVRCAPKPEKVLVGIQGVCSMIAQAYMADLPEQVQRSRTFRDVLKRDSMQKQQEKFVIRGQREKEMLRHAANVTGRTEFDRIYVEQQNSKAQYFSMNETLRSCFYEGEWRAESCEPHSIFLSQGDYPLKGLHYMLLAAAKLRQKYPDLKIYVAGNSLVKYKTLTEKIKISAYGKYLRSLMEQYALGDCVQFLGRLTALEMKAQYLKSNLFVCCSSNENSPNSLGEAMILGVPCVAAAVGGIPSLFEDGKDGILYAGYEDSVIELNNGSNCKKTGGNLSERVENKINTDVIYKSDGAENADLYRNADNLYLAVCKMWENQEQMKGFCQNARIHARKTHNREENYQKMLEIYAAIARLK